MLTFLNLIKEKLKLKRTIGLRKETKLLPYDCKKEVKKIDFSTFAHKKHRHIEKKILIKKFSSQLPDRDPKTGRFTKKNK